MSAVLGLRANVRQFALLVAVSALVGGMVGQERTVLPLLATDVFGLTGFVSALTFVWFAASALLGVGTAMVYPTLLAAVADVARSRDGAGSAIGVYRLWRDLGFAIGALVAGGDSGCTRDAGGDRNDSGVDRRRPALSWSFGCARRSSGT